jgi:hypothetical protein
MMAAFARVLACGPGALCAIQGVMCAPGRLTRCSKPQLSAQYVGIGGCIMTGAAASFTIIV